jgi:4-hydroxysphinganine ceramide fatty acyl 2-hydroxylase
MSPSRTLPTFLYSELESHNTKESCWVTIGTRVFDVTDFVESHPGGGDLVLEYGGKDVTEILKDEDSHTHSEAAYEILDDSLIGFVATPKIIDATVKSSRPDEIVPLPPSLDGITELAKVGAVDALPTYAATGMASAEDLSKETDLTNDYKTHKFLDLNKPLLLQVWFGGFSKDFYLEQVHRPRHYKGGESAPLFGNFRTTLKDSMVGSTTGLASTSFLRYIHCSRGLFEHLTGSRVLAFWSLLLDYYRICDASVPISSRQVSRISKFDIL